MKKTNIPEMLQAAGMTIHRCVNGQVNASPCPFCQDKKPNHFYVNEEIGVGDCKKCGVAFSFEKLQKALFQGRIDFEIDKTTIPKRKRKEANAAELDLDNVLSDHMKLCTNETVKRTLDYLRNRGLELDTLEHFLIGVDRYENICIPIIENNQVVNIRKRLSPFTTKKDMPKFHTTKGGKTALFNGDILKDKVDRVFLTEGEIDAMTLWQLGEKNVVSVTLGAQSFPDSWIERLNNAKEVILCYDTDTAGTEGAEKAAMKIGRHKCKLFKVPEGKDLNEYYIKRRPDLAQFEKDLEEGISAMETSEDIKHAAEYIDPLLEMLKRGDYTGLATGYDELDKIIGGYREGRMIVLSGLTSVGKTTFSQNLSLSLAHRNVPCMYVSMEMPPIDLFRKFVLMHGKITSESLEQKVQDVEGLQEVTDLMGQFGHMPLYFFEQTGVLDADAVIDACTRAHKMTQSRVLIIDHLHYLAQGSNNRAVETSNLVRRFKQLATDLNVTVILLAHLNRSGRNLQKRGMYIPVLSDLKDAGAIEQDADQVVFVCRDSETKEEADRSKVIIKVAKNRDGMVGHVNFNFRLELGYFSEVHGVDYGPALEKAAKEKKVVDTKSPDVLF